MICHKQVSNGQPFFPLNDEHMRNKVGVVRTNPFASYSKKKASHRFFGDSVSFVRPFFLENKP